MRLVLLSQWLRLAVWFVANGKETELILHATHGGSKVYGRREGPSCN